MKKQTLHQLLWFAAMPTVIGFFYWFSLRSFAFTSGNGIRIPALPKVFFDQTMYLEVMAKDIIHGFHILPLPVRPFVALARAAWPTVTLSEMYVIGIILAAIASLWLFAALIRRMNPEMSVADARIRSVAVFLMVQSVLILRPGAPSWYVPFFLLAILLVWMGERLWDRSRLHVALAWIGALILSTVYPWYFATIVAMIGILFVLRWVRPNVVLPGVAIGIILALIVIACRDAIVQAVLSSYAVMLAYYGGVQFSHLTTISNTILLMVGWIALWLPIAIHDARKSEKTSVSTFLLVAWVGILLLWFQSVLTGLSIVPDHFIYSVWIVSAISWAVGMTSDVSGRERMVRLGIGVIAALYVISVIGRMAMGAFDWTTYPSLLIHVGSWTFLALAALPVPRRYMTALALILGIASTIFGMTAVRTSALARADIDRELDGVRQWVAATNPSTDLRWCSDTLSADYLFSTTGYAMYPTFSEKHDPASITQLQNRLVEISGFYNPRAGGDLYMWDDMILHDLEFPCRVFGLGIDAVDALPLSHETKTFLTGCNQPWADTERARVVARIDTVASAPLPESSPLCDRFVVRKRLKDAWRIPASYRLLYEDERAAVYGVR